MIRLTVWIQSLRWRIAAERHCTLNWWYLGLAAVSIVWLGLAEAVALPAYGGYMREVLANMLAGLPSTPPAAVQVTVFQWSCSVVWLVLAYRQWARRQFKWMIVLMACSLLYVPFVIYLVHEVMDQRKGIVRLEEKPEEPDIVAVDEMIDNASGTGSQDTSIVDGEPEPTDSSIAASANAGSPAPRHDKVHHGSHS